MRSAASSPSSGLLRILRPSDGRHRRERLREWLWKTAVHLGREYPAERLSESLIVFAPHPDDETLGCGGLILRKRDVGTTVHVVFMTDGARSHAAYMPAAELRAHREREAREACQRLGIDESAIVFCGFPDGELRASRAEAVARVTERLGAIRPREVAIPYRHDVTPDHLATREIVLAAIRASAIKVRVVEYPVWFWRTWPWTP